MENKNSNYILPASIIVAAVLISGSIIYLVGSSKTSQSGSNGGAQQPNSQLSSINSQDVILGDPNAPVTLIEYGDYQCTYCNRFFADTESLINQNYVQTGKVKMVYRNFQFLGPESTSAAEAAACAQEQNKFWAYHDAIYSAESKDGTENNGNLTRDLFIQLAKNVDLDVSKFTTCYDSNKYESMVKQETSAAAALGIQSTPTFFVNGQQINGAVPYSQFQTIFDNALKSASSK